jgi:hypothetical protein
VIAEEAALVRRVRERVAQRVVDTECRVNVAAGPAARERDAQRQNGAPPA